MPEQARPEACFKRRIVTIQTEVILLDVRGYSTRSDAEQLLVVETLTDRLRQLVALLVGLGGIHVHELAKDPLIIGYVPTGDGAYLILNPLYAGYGILLATAIRNDLVLINKKCGGALYEGIRVASHLGPCISYLDITARVNFAGRGLNDCSRILQAHCAPDFPEGFTDHDYVVASSDAIACFDDLYYSKIGPRQRGILKQTRSRPFQVVDKHGREHTVQLIEMHRNVALQPFKPVVDLSEEKRILMREIAANRLPELPTEDPSAMGPVIESPDAAAGPPTTSPQRQAPKERTGNVEEKSLDGQEER
jgi:hypothetical protein